jgi:outer membrane protein insertion porin family
LVLKTHTEFGYLGAYNNDRGIIPFERFYLGGDGLSQYALDGRETIAMRGYENQSLSDRDGATIYNKFSLELRYPITLKPSASIFALSFLEAANSYNNFKQYNPFDMKRSAGFGIRIFMPAFGLLGIDFGYGFDSAVEGDLSPSRLGNTLYHRAAILICFEKNLISWAFLVLYNFGRGPKPGSYRVFGYGSCA